jgi:hypothetical protein
MSVINKGGIETSMVTIVRNFTKPLLIFAVILLTGCASTSSAVVTTPAPVKTDAQQSAQTPAVQPSTQPNQASAQTETKPASNATGSTGTKPAEPLSTRLDVIYFHVNQRCVTCLCFEEHVNTVIEKYFGDAIASGKLTYRVLNSQEPQNAALAKKYGAVGSQLFINKVVNGFDNIEDIQSIWDWNCRNNPAGFELKVKNIIEQSL